MPHDRQFAGHRPQRGFTASQTRRRVRGRDRVREVIVPNEDSPLPKHDLLELIAELRRESSSPTRIHRFPNAGKLRRILMRSRTPFSSGGGEGADRASPPRRRERRDRTVMRRSADRAPAGKTPHASALDSAGAAGIGAICIARVVMATLASSFSRLIGSL